MSCAVDIFIPYIDKNTAGNTQCDDFCCKLVEKGKFIS